MDGEYKKAGKAELPPIDNTSKRLDYVKYDEKAVAIQDSFKSQCLTIEAMMNGSLGNGRAKAVALTKLEEVYMWIGKQIRDDQIARNGSAPLQEERKDG